MVLGLDGRWSDCYTEIEESPDVFRDGSAESMEFINAFVSYGLLMLIIVVLCGIGMFCGITLRKRKDAALKAAETSEASQE